MIGALASIKAPEMFSSVVMVGPSPRYINDGSYIGGFEQEDIDELLASLAENHIAWSNAMAPTIMGNSDRPELASELPTASVGWTLKLPEPSPGDVYLRQQGGFAQGDGAGACLTVP